MAQWHKTLSIVTNDYNDDHTAADDDDISDAQKLTKKLLTNSLTNNF